jgi:hypothetical protein
MTLEDLLQLSWMSLMVFMPPVGLL